jgi:hypothetical protein
MSHHQDLLDVNIVLSLQAMLHQYNPYIETFLTAHECVTGNANISLRIKLVDLPHYDSRRYNRPTANEVVVIMVGTGDEPKWEEISYYKLKAIAFSKSDKNTVLLLYVALSQCSDSRNIRVLLPPNTNRRTLNIIYREAID